MASTAIRAKLILSGPFEGRAAWSCAIHTNQSRNRGETSVSLAGFNPQRVEDRMGCSDKFHRSLAAITLTSTAAALLIVEMPTSRASADIAISTVLQPTNIAAQDGRVVWSTYDPATRRFALTQHFDGITSTVPVAPRRVPFDADLGPGPNGETIATYSRCRREAMERPDMRGPSFGVPHYQFARGCDLFAFEFDRGREIRLRGVSTRGASEYLPAIWRGQIAFARSYASRHGRRSRVPRIYLASLNRSADARRIRTGPPGKAPGPIVSSLDLRGSRLTFLWRYFPRPRRGRQAFLDVFQVRLARKRRQRTSKAIAEARVSTDDSLSTAYLSSPLMFDRHVYYFSGTSGEGEAATIFRLSLTGGAADVAIRTVAREGISLALDGKLTYFVKPLPYLDISGRRFEITRAEVGYRPLR
jgi:hypothetical protein